MSRVRAFILLLSLLLVGAPLALSRRTPRDTTFAKNFRLPAYCNGTYCTLWPDGTVSLTAAKNKMGGFESKSYYQYGIFEAKIRLPAGYSGGLIPCLYLMSGNSPDYRSIHDEMDFEFLGSDSPKNIKIHTNLIAGGYTFVEQYNFPFDPSAGYHTYTMVYAPDWVIWKVDGQPIRITWRESGKPFPSLPMRVQGSIWDASFWLPIKSDYTKGNVTVKFRRFDVKNTCRTNSPSVIPACPPSKNVKKAPWLFRPTRNDIAHAKRHKTVYLHREFGGWQKVV